MPQGARGYPHGDTTMTYCGVRLIWNGSTLPGEELPQTPRVLHGPDIRKHRVGYTGEEHAIHNNSRGVMADAAIRLTAMFRQGKGHLSFSLFLF